MPSLCTSSGWLEVVLTRIVPNWIAAGRSAIAGPVDSHDNVTVLVPAAALVTVSVARRVPTTVGVHASGTAWVAPIGIGIDAAQVCPPTQPSARSLNWNSAAAAPVMVIAVTVSSAVPVLPSVRVAGAPLPTPTGPNRTGFGVIVSRPPPGATPVPETPIVRIGVVGSLLFTTSAAPKPPTEVGLKRTSNATESPGASTTGNPVGAPCSVNGGAAGMRPIAEMFRVASPALLSVTV